MSAPNQVTTLARRQGYDVHRGLDGVKTAAAIGAGLAKATPIIIVDA